MLRRAAGRMPGSPVGNHATDADPALVQTQDPKRLFFALWPPEAVRGEISTVADNLIKQRGLTGHKSRRRRYHLTLFFLGDKVTADIEVAAHKAAARIRAPSFSLRLDQAGSFNNREIPVWLGCSDIPAELRFLDQALRRQLKGLTCERQPRFAPHVTILRNATTRLPLTAVTPVDWAIQEFVLIHSSISDHSVEYTVLQRYPLKGPPLAPEPQQGKLF